MVSDGDQGMIFGERERKWMETEEAQERILGDHGHMEKEMEVLSIVEIGCLRLGNIGVMLSEESTSVIFSLFL